MTAGEYKQYCMLQEQIRAAGFPQDFDEGLKTGVLNNAQYFQLECMRWGEPSDDRLRYDLKFYKLDGSEDFTFDHFHATYRKNIIIPDIKINGVQMSSLEERMRMVNWNTLSQTAASREVFVASRVKMNDIIYGIMDELEALGKTPQGREVRDLIEAKYLSETEPVKAVSHQDYDEINNRYAVKLTVPVRGTDTIPCGLLDHIFENDLPLPVGLKRPHEVFKVAVSGFNMSEKGFLAGFETFEDDRYFSTLKNAVDHVRQFEDQEFQPYHVLWSGHKRVLQQATVIDDVSHKPIASKFGYWSDMSSVDLTSNIVRWVVIDKNMSVPQFEQKSGFQISTLARLVDHPNVFQAYPTQDQQQEKKKENKLPARKQIKQHRKGKGRQQ